MDTSAQKGSIVKYYKYVYCNINFIAKKNRAVSDK